MRRLYRNLAIILAMMSLALSIYAIVKSTMLMELVYSDLEALSYSNEQPGPQGERHPQAVWCGGGGWVIKPGCCYGSENCDNMDPCNGQSFKCG